MFFFVAPKEHKMNEAWDGVGVTSTILNLIFGIINHENNIKIIWIGHIKAYKVRTK